MVKNLFLSGEQNIAKRPDIKEKIRLSKIKPTDHKICNVCKIDKLASEYYRRTDSQALKWCCIKCDRELWHKSKTPEIIKKRSEYNKKRNLEFKHKILEHYGAVCVCCGTTGEQFLSIDHINGGGNKHRKTAGTGVTFKKWIIDNNYPKDFQILCHNCNQAKRDYDQCPHNKLKEV